MTRTTVYHGKPLEDEKDVLADVYHNPDNPRPVVVSTSKGQQFRIRESESVDICIDGELVDESADESDVDHETRIRELTYSYNDVEEGDEQDNVYHVSFKGMCTMGWDEFAAIRESDDYELYSVNPDRVRVKYVGDEQ